MGSRGPQPIAGRCLHPRGRTADMGAVRRWSAFRTGLDLTIYFAFAFAVTFTIGVGGPTPDLGELRAVVEVCGFDLRNIFLRWICILQRTVMEDIGGRDTINRVIHHVRRGASQRNVALVILLYIGQK